MSMTTPKTYKKYDRGHRFDEGAIQAYHRGEKPSTYWTKKSILDDLFYTIDHADLTLEPIYNKFETNKTEVKKKISEIPVKRLKLLTLKHTGTHHTGNYYQNTSFYRTLNISELPDFVTKYAVQPFINKQLKLL